MPHLFTSESVTEGHPDKLADQISDSILDAYLAVDSKSRVARETLITPGEVHVGGEVTSTGQVNTAEVVRGTILRIGYDSTGKGFAGRTCKVNNFIGRQSPNIAQGVDRAERARKDGAKDEFDLQGAGDQGMMFGFACSETPELMPLPIVLAHRLAKRLSAVRHDGTLPCLRPDGKTQVTIRYEGLQPVGLETVVVSAQHTEETSIDGMLRAEIVRHVVEPELVDLEMPTSSYELYVNPTGSFAIGGPQADAGLTGRKVIVDTYGGYARHGGGAFSGKDPSKVDRSAAYVMRWVAKKRRRGRPRRANRGPGGVRHPGARTQ